MSALWATCPLCGPLVAIIPQGGRQFEMDIKCLCGQRIHYKENGNPGTEYHRSLARFKGKTPVHKKQISKKNEQADLVNNCFD